MVTVTVRGPAAALHAMSNVTSILVEFTKVVLLTAIPGPKLTWVGLVKPVPRTLTGTRERPAPKNPGDVEEMASGAVVTVNAFASVTISAPDCTVMDLGPSGASSAMVTYTPMRVGVGAPSGYVKPKPVKLTACATVIPVPRSTMLLLKPVCKKWVLEP